MNNINESKKNTYCSNSKCEFRHECLRQLLYEQGNMQGKWIMKFDCTNNLKYFVSKENKNENKISNQQS